MGFYVLIWRNKIDIVNIFFIYNIISFNVYLKFDEYIIDECKYISKIGLVINI